MLLILMWRKWKTIRNMVFKLILKLLGYYIWWIKFFISVMKKNRFGSNKLSKIIFLVASKILISKIQIWISTKYFIWFHCSRDTEVKPGCITWGIFTEEMCVSNLSNSPYWWKTEWIPKSHLWRFFSARRKVLSVGDLYIWGNYIN